MITGKYGNTGNDILSWDFLESSTVDIRNIGFNFRTDALSKKDCQNLFDILKKFKGTDLVKGVESIYIVVR